MGKTGESYAAARSHVVQKRDRLQAAQERLAAPDERPTDEKVVEMTGKPWAAWFSILDRWGGRNRTHSETAAYLMAEHAVPSWWAQTITVWYQRSRGMGHKQLQADGLTISASKTLAAPGAVIFDAFIDPGTRQRWLDEPMSLRTSQPGRTARFDWGDGSTRVNVSFEARGPKKTTVAVAHERLPDPDEAEMAKVAWRERLAGLKSFLEA